MKIHIEEWGAALPFVLFADSELPSDPPEIPEKEPEGISVRPPETIPQPDKGPFSPDEPEQIPPLPIPEHPSPGPASPDHPTMQQAVG
ncbi:chitin-binding protein [Brucella gallinifaecis]|uniref:Chitin-binding protein n=1 Tax=Brucella gallinifaecis TaxID=215590 RepID=A0A502BN69_9HYPH|nr:chitin-binding protein [Brucella gallinifaecis]TPF74513.1 chitin-binding protein [Brucella gallinifaecis]